MDEVQVYWRPGCLYCVGLLRSLDRAGIPYAKVNIWEDDEAAAFVRSVAGGDETVPTVLVSGGRALVNPTGRELAGVLGREAPELLPPGYEPPPPSLLERVLALFR